MASRPLLMLLTTARNCQRTRSLITKAVYSQDIIWAKKSIFFVSPFITPKRVAQILQLVQEPLARKVEVTIVTRPAEEFAERFKTALEQILAGLKQAGVSVVFKPKIHQKFAIIDKKIVWYGSII